MRTNAVAVSIFSFFMIGCRADHIERQNIPPESFSRSGISRIAELKVQSPFIKVHMKNGNLYVFDSWNVDDTKKKIAGHATLYGPVRDKIMKGKFTLGLDSVALLETNVIRNSGAANAITVFTGISAGLTVYCIANPKACFGSCPTFYVSDGTGPRLQAEGFSSSISPSLEASDVDALYHARASNGEMTVEMKNEALETHVVRYVDMLVVPKKAGERIFFGRDRQFWRTQKIVPPDSANGPEGNCLRALSDTDGSERFSLADEAYLGAKEIIELNFAVKSAQAYGLVIGCRQSLLPTYLLYQALAYMGNDAGYWLAEIERNKIQASHSGMERLIGGIEILVRQQNGEWRVVDIIDEHGPLASDLHLIPLGNLHSANLRLRLTKGAWRLDYAALAELTDPIKAIRLRPTVAIRNKRDDEEALALLLDSTKVLATLPGDAYTLKYRLPDPTADYEFFLESWGYYLEWIRKEWIEEESSLLLAEMFLFPEQALRRMAPEFKRVEATMEDSFWRSRYAKP